MPNDYFSRKIVSASVLNDRQIAWYFQTKWLVFQYLLHILIFNVNILFVIVIIQNCLNFLNTRRIVYIRIKRFSIIELHFQEITNRD